LVRLLPKLLFVAATTLMAATVQFDARIAVDRAWGGVAGHVSFLPGMRAYLPGRPLNPGTIVLALAAVCLLGRLRPPRRRGGDGPPRRSAAPAAACRRRSPPALPRHRRPRTLDRHERARAIRPVPDPLPGTHPSRSRDDPGHRRRQRDRHRVLLAAGRVRHAR